MAMSLLGETIDVHCGGVDLIFPHHEDEIAQSEAATGKTFARVWCHGGFLLTEGTKMAKRLGNVWTVMDLRREGVPPAAVRYLYFSTHYRKELNLAGDAVEGAIEAVRRIGTFKVRLDGASGGTPELAASAERAEARVREALFDDLNAPEALAALMTFITEANAELDRRGSDASALERARRAFATIDGVLDVTPSVRSETVRVDGGDPREPEALLAAAPADAASAEYGRWVGEMLGSRQLWRQARQFAKADAIRAALVERGVQVEDTPQGARWTLMG
jgi:cysteinyl-tRNA synthetase